MWVGDFSLLYKMGYIAGGCIFSTGRAKPDMKVFAGDWGEKILKVGARHIISNCRVLKTLKFAAAEPLEKALQSVSKNSKQQYQNPFVGLTFMVSWWVFCQEPPHIWIGNFLLSFSQQPCLRSWAPGEKMLHSHVFCTVWGMLFEVKEIVGAFEWIPWALLQAAAECRVCHSPFSSHFGGEDAPSTSHLLLWKCSFENGTEPTNEEKLFKQHETESLLSMAKNIPKGEFIYCLSRRS